MATAEMKRTFIRRVLCICCVLRFSATEVLVSESRFPLRAHDERTSETNGSEQAFFFSQFHQPIPLGVGEGLRRVGALERGVVEVAHDLHGRLVAYRPES